MVKGNLISKQSFFAIKRTLIASLLYFACLGIGVLLNLIFDRNGNMFYAPAFSAVFSGILYFQYLLKKNFLWFNFFNFSNRIALLFILRSFLGNYPAILGICSTGRPSSQVRSLQRRHQKQTFLYFIFLNNYWSYFIHVVGTKGLPKNAFRTRKRYGLHY